MDVDDDFTNIFIFDGGWWGCVHCAIAALGNDGHLWATNGGHVVLLDAVANSQQFNDGDDDDNGKYLNRLFIAYG